MTSYFASLKSRLIAWYDAHIVAGWYRSYALLAGWFAAGVMFLPNILDYVGSNWAGLAGLVVPTWSTETQALVMGLYVTVVAPPLRAWAQKKMQEAALVQAAKSGAVGSFIGSEKIMVAVEGREPLIVDPMVKGEAFEDTQ